jgi:hypothetical protein
VTDGSSSPDESMITGCAMRRLSALAWPAVMDIANSFLPRGTPPVRPKGRAGRNRSANEALR